MKLNFIAENDNKFFTYVEMAKDMWRKKIQEAQKEFKINFDLENDSEIAQKTIVIDQQHWEDTKCKFNCALWSAGGDWESPVLYVRIQIMDGYAKGMSTYGDNIHSIFIPNKDQGNHHLIKTKHGWSAPDADCDDEADEKEVWESTKEYLKKLVDAEIAEVAKE